MAFMVCHVYTHIYMHTMYIFHQSNSIHIHLCILKHSFYISKHFYVCESVFLTVRFRITHAVPPRE